jgi:hypothetical protein
MDDGQLLEALRVRIRCDATAVSPCATLAEVEDFQRVADLTLPAFYVKLVTEVANGGFGPGCGLIGIPPGGYVEADLREDLLNAYLHGRVCPDLAWRTPRGLLALCTWGCAIYSYVDCLTELGAVVTDEVFDDRIEYTETASSLAGWFADWLSGHVLEAAMHEVIGYREGTNPFTKEPIKIPRTVRIGKRLNFADRL